jgi:transposase
MDHAQEVPAGTSVGNPEVPEKAKRRRFEAAYKLRILEEAGRLTGPGELGELLRREGLYSSHLTSWRRQRDEGSLAGLAPKRRGRKAKRKDALAKENERLRRSNQRLAERLRQAETIIDVQKKVSEMLALSPEEHRPLEKPDDGENE